MAKSTQPIAKQKAAPNRRQRPELHIAAPPARAAARRPRTNKMPDQKD
jgi:hypothetical protein